MSLVHVGIGSNLGDPSLNVRRAIAALAEIGSLEAQSSLYRTSPWGKRDQPDFVNAVVALETTLGPRDLLERLKTLEQRLGRTPSERWGPRAIDLDILLYGDVVVDDADLTIPHRHLYKRSFVLVPLAEIDERFVAARDALPLSLPAAGAPGVDSESIALMSEDQSIDLAGRVSRLAEFFVTTDLMRLRIERGEDHLELGRHTLHPDLVPEIPTDVLSVTAAPPVRLDLVKADLVGIFRFARPVPGEGDLLEADRELGYIEALGIRNPVRSHGAGRIVSVTRTDGDAVEYGQVLFEIDRG